MKNMKRAERRTWLETRKTKYLQKCLNYKNRRSCDDNYVIRKTNFNYKTILLDKDNQIVEYWKERNFSIWYNSSSFFTQVKLTEDQKRKYLSYFFNRHKAGYYRFIDIGFTKSHSDWKIYGLQKKHINKARNMLEDYNNWCDDNNQIPRTNIHKYCRFPSDRIYD